MRQITRWRGGWRNVLVLSLAAVLIGGVAAYGAGDIKTKLPEKSVLYLEFAGADRFSEANRTTPFGALLRDPQFAKLTSALWAAGDKALADNAAKEGKGEVYAAAKDMALMLWHKGVAIDVIGATVAGGAAGAADAPAGGSAPASLPVFSAIIASDLGDQAGAFVERLEAILRTTPLPPAFPEEIDGRSFKTMAVPIPFVPPVRYGVVDGTFVIAIGPEAPKMVLAAMGGKAPNLTANASLAAALKKIGMDGRATIGLLHIDVAELLDQGRKVYSAMTSQPDWPPMVATLLEELGINGLTGITYCGQIADGGFRRSAFYAMKGPRKGLLKLADQAPLTDDDLKWVPKDATMAMAVNVRLADLYDEAMRVLAVVPAPVKSQVDEALAKFKEASGLDLRKDILGVLDDGWIMFDAPSAGWLTGMTLVVQVRDTAAAEKLIRHGVEALIKAMGNDVRATIMTTDLGRYKIQFLQFTNQPVPVAPAWCLHEGRLVVGPLPPTVRAAMDRMLSADSRGASILANIDFESARKALPGPANTMIFVDTRAGVRGIYPLAAFGGTAGIGMAQKFGIPIDASMIPDAPMLTSGLYADVLASSTDDDGTLAVSRGPLPLPVPPIASGGVASASMLVSVLLPSLSRARELSKRLVSATNLKGMGTCCLIYANEHDEVFPPDLETLVRDGCLMPKMLDAPSDRAEDLEVQELIALGYVSADKAAAAAGKGARCSYAYLAGHTGDSDPRWVVAYEKWEDQDDEGANVLFVDGHVEFIKPLDRVEELVAQTKAEMAKRK